MAFPITVTPELLVHLVQGSIACDDPASVELVTRAVIAHADQAWREAESAVRAALRFDPLPDAATGRS